MNNADFARDMERRTIDEDGTVTNEAGARFTPAEFFKEAGIIIAASLALGLLVQIVLG